MGLFDLFTGHQPPLVQQAFQDVKVMLQNGHDMFAAATGCLLDNEILELDLGATDQKVNQREQDLRRVVLEHLTIDPDRELIFSLKLLSIVHEAERIGDLSKSLAKTAALADRPRMGPCCARLRDIRDQILDMFGDVRKGFVEADEAAALRIMESHEVLKAKVSTYLEELAHNDDLSPNEAVVYALSAQLISRVSSHLANIASTVASPFDQIRRAPATR